jgi:hypothetical protein
VYDLHFKEDLPLVRRNDVITHSLAPPLRKEGEMHLLDFFQNTPLLFAREELGLS